MMRQARSLILTACLAGMLSACATPRPSANDMERKFYSQPLKTQMVTFRNYSISDQLTLYLYGNQVRHPPAIYLSECFALSGAPAREVLRSRLKGRLDDLTVRDIATLIAAIDAAGTSIDQEIIGLLRQQIASMQDREWRELAAHEVEQIGRTPRRDPGQLCQ